MWKEWMSTICPEGCWLPKSVGYGMRETEVRLDGWCEGGLRQQRNDGGGCTTMRERSKRVESPGTYVTEWVSLSLFAWLCVLSDHPPVLWWLSPGEQWDAITWCGYDKLKRVQLLKIKAQVSSIWAKRRILMTGYVFHLTWHEHPSLV